MNLIFVLLTAFVSGCLEIVPSIFFCPARPGDLGDSVHPEIWLETAQTVLHHQNVFRVVDICVFAIGDVDRRNSTCCTFVSTIRALPLPTEACLTLIMVGLRCRANVVQFPNVSVSGKHVVVALNVVKVVKDKVVSGHCKRKAAIWFR